MAGGSVWAGLAAVMYEIVVVDGGMVSDPSRGVALAYWVLVWVPLFAAALIWQRWGRAAFPLRQRTREPSEA